MNVRIKTMLTLKRLIGDGNLQLVLDEGATLKNLLDTMITIWGDKTAREIYVYDGKQVSSHYRFMVNGQDMEALAGLSTILHENDEVIIFPIITGG